MDSSSRTMTPACSMRMGFLDSGRSRIRYSKILGGRRPGRTHLGDRCRRGQRDHRRLEHRLSHRCSFFVSRTRGAHRGFKSVGNLVRLEFSACLSVSKIPTSRTIGGGLRRDTGSFCTRKAKRLLPTRNEESVVGPVLRKRRSRRCGRIREQCRRQRSCVTGCASCFVLLTLRAAYGRLSPRRSGSVMERSLEVYQSENLESVPLLLPLPFQFRPLFIRP